MPIAAPPMNEAAKIISVPKAVELLGGNVSQHYISDLCKTGKVRAKKHGNKWLINTRSLLDFFEIID